jgi:hypothetical protein
MSLHTNSIYHMHYYLQSFVYIYIRIFFVLYYISFELCFYMYCIILPLIWPNLLAYCFQELCLFVCKYKYIYNFWRNAIIKLLYFMLFYSLVNVYMLFAMCFNFSICQLVCGTFIYISWFIISWLYNFFLLFHISSIFIIYSIFIHIHIDWDLIYIYLCPLYTYIFLCCVKRVVLRRAHSLCLYLVLIPYL